MLSVAKSPTCPETGVRSVTKQIAVYAGLEVPTAEEEGLITTVALAPSKGHKVASTVAAA
jgi:hypothetical protein